MQQSFLEYVLQNLTEKGVPVQECTFVLPSKRSGTFLKKYISKALDKNVFSPKVLAIEDFVTQISGLTQASNLDLLFQLYVAYKQIELKEHDDFDTFMKWGQTLLQDFNEIGRYLIPPKDILNYLSAIKELNHWSLQKEKSELVQNYLQLWGSLHQLYESFTTLLFAQNKGYQGLIYRTAAENLDSHKELSSKGPLIFVGFNALNAAEVKIIQHYLENPKNLIYWDIDSYFLDNTIHDVGYFIRNYKSSWSFYHNRQLDGIHNSFLEPKTIHITGVPKSISQAQYVGKLLEEIHLESAGGIQNTALVLADESLLNPMLQAIPSCISQVNITMGLPLNKTVLYSFFLSLLDLQTSRTERGWFFEDVLSFFSNPFSQSLSANEGVDIAADIPLDIKQHNRLYIHPNYLEKFEGQTDLLALFFPKNSASPIQWIENSLNLIQRLKTILQQNNQSLELEHLYRFHNLFNQLKQQISAVNFITNLKSAKSFFKQMASSETTDFIGEPLSGLQIMGMLESRNLDFETVILTSVNEGVLPSGKSNNSFFPFDVKREFGLPTYKEKDAIYTYHFYRLIQRAKNVYLVYNTEPDVLEGGEKSRLVSQLMTDRNISKFVQHSIASPKVKMNPASLSRIEIGPQLEKDIKTFAGNGFSPTSLTNYIRNPLDFYKKNILKIRDVEEMEETIAANTFGTIIHDSLEAMYGPLINMVLQPHHIIALKKQVPQVLKANFMKLLPGVEIQKGRYLLVFQVIVKYLNNFLDLEMNQLKKHEIKILALEEKLETAIEIPSLAFPIKLKGTLDRVDEVDGSLRIVDYKTGRVERRHVKITDWDELSTNYDKSKAFQLLCYAYLYHKKLGKEEMIAGIYTFKNLGQGFLPFISGTQLINLETLNTFEHYLHGLVLEICAPNVPFVEKEV